MVHGWRVCPEPRSSLRLPSADVKAPRHVGTKATAAAAARWRLTRPLPARSAPAERPTEPTHSREDAREHAHRHDQVERVHVACVRHNIVDVPRGAAARATRAVRRRRCASHTPGGNTSRLEAPRRARTRDKGTENVDRTSGAKLSSKTACANATLTVRRAARRRFGGGGGGRSTCRRHPAGRPSRRA
eukprot:5419061-Prymnesium_polylepis.1